MVISFGGVARVEVPFTEGRDIRPRRMSANGLTPMGAAIDMGLDQLEAQKAAYRQAGLEYFRPWFFVLTDGEPTDGPVFDAAVARLRAAEAAKRVSVFPIAVGQEANMQILGTLSKQRQPVRLLQTHFSEFFRWLSASLSAVSASQAFGANDNGVAAAEQVALPAPTGWATV